MVCRLVMETDCQKQHGSRLKTGIPAFGDTAMTTNRYIIGNSTYSKDPDNYVFSRIDIGNDELCLCHRPVFDHPELLISPTCPF